MQNPFAPLSREDLIARILLGASLASLGLAIAAFVSGGGPDLSPSARGVVLSALLVAAVLKAASRLVGPVGAWLDEQS